MLLTLFTYVPNSLLAQEKIFWQRNNVPKPF